jgi:predicted nucleotidyltransferase
MDTLSLYKKEINTLCANHRVKSLYAFGSVLTPNFNTKSDIDLIVDFKEIDVKDYAE